MGSVAHDRRGPCTVIKLGGSVLRSLRAYRHCAAVIARRVQAEPGRRWVLVVSARYGVTNRLAKLAAAVGGDPDTRTRDLLWSTGETYSVAVLTLALRRMGVDAAGMNVHECGLCVDGAGHVRVEPDRSGARFAEHAVLVIPGFIALDEDQRIVSLGRGGSDLTAVVAAAAIRAERCELIKDVGGYFTADPRHVGAAERIARLSYAEALTLADGGCPVVQREALCVAARESVVLRVCALEGSDGGTIVGGGALPVDRAEATQVRCVA